MKGISTIVSTVMVLAVAISMVGIFSGWAPNVLNDVLDTTESQTTNQTNCNQATISIRSAKYYNGGNVAVTVSNESTVKVGNIRVSAWDSGELLGSQEELLNEGLETVNFSAGSEPSRVEAESLRCQSATDESTEIQ